MTRHVDPLRDPGTRWTAVLDGVGEEYTTRAGAVHRLAHEMDHWIRHARFFEPDLVDELERVKAEIVSCHKDNDWSFPLGRGMTGRCGLRAPKWAMA